MHNLMAYIIPRHPGKEKGDRTITHSFFLSISGGMEGEEGYFENGRGFEKHYTAIKLGGKS
jgi:hypothetical protein